METDSIIIVSCVGAAFIIGATGIAVGMVIKAFKGNSPSGLPAGDEDETRLIQEIYHGLTKMEDRIETLETLLIDSEHKKAEARKLSDFDRNLERG